MHRSRFLTQRLLRSPTWCVIKSNIICASGTINVPSPHQQQMQVRGKKTDPTNKNGVGGVGSGDDKSQHTSPSSPTSSSSDGKPVGGGESSESGSSDIGPVGNKTKKATVVVNSIVFGDNNNNDDPLRKRNMVEEMEKMRNFTSTERNFITPLRAMQEYLLQPHDLSGLRKTMRRSPHADEPPILVYWRRDVEARANEIWGGKENIRKERRIRVGAPEYNEATVDVRSVLKKYRKEYRDAKAPPDSEKSGLREGSGRIVLTAVVINGTNFVIKLLAWYMTGSHSLFAEAIHSLADTINQIILAYGIHKSTQSANMDHPYGYANMRHVASLISGVGIFCVGAGLSLYHGFTGLVGMQPIESLYWALCILAGSLVSEGATLFLACNSVRKRAKEVNITFRDFILRGRDPSLNVVILEDTAAVAGVGIAATCMALTMYFQSPIPDALGSLAIGGLLGGVASFIIYSNSAALVGRSIPKDNLDAINTELEDDVMIRAIHDVKGIDMGNNMVRYKAEVDFDGRELTRAYLMKQDVETMMKELQAIKTDVDLENFVLKHGENIVDTLGAEIDRIEKRLRKSHPEIRHCDLEIL